MVTVFEEFMVSLPLPKVRSLSLKNKLIFKKIFSSDHTKCWQRRRTTRSLHSTHCSKGEMECLVSCEKHHTANPARANEPILLEGAGT